MKRGKSGKKVEMNYRTSVEEWPEWKQNALGLKIGNAVRGKRKQGMKVKELIEFVNSLSGHQELKSFLDWEVSIALAEDCVGACGMSPVHSFSFGFDWEHGHLLVITKDELVRPDRAPQYFLDQYGDNWYVIPKSKKSEWYQFWREDTTKVPEYAFLVDGPGSVEFSFPEVND